jgi:predicted amidohydrolase YtcJ
MYADIIIIGNRIFDGVKREPFEGFVAIKDNRLVRVDCGPIPPNLAGPDTQIHEFQDNLIMPGFHDSHTHLLMAGMFKTYPNLAEANSEDEAARMMNEAVLRSGEESEWIIGFSWYHVFWENKSLPTKKSLDQFFPDRPVFLLNAEAHGAWVNSKALEIAGITDDTPDPFGGEITRDTNGEATGFLYESAVGLVSKYALAMSKEQERHLILAYMSGANKLGITSVNDVQPYFHGNMGSLDVYSKMDQEGELTVRIHAAPDLLGDLDVLDAERKKYRSDRMRVDHVKQFLDGVSTTHTALMLEDYEDAPGNVGIPLMDTELIRQAVPEAHRRGFSVKLHACGDKSARLALDFFEEAMRLHGKNHCRHAIEHVEVISDQDIPRFGDLGIIPSVQPEHLALTQKFKDNPYPMTLGEERTRNTWPNKRLYESAGVLAVGSDCPVVDNDPFLEIYRAVTRVHNDGEPVGGWNPEEKLSMYEILRSYTYGSAFGAGRENELGTLEDGKFADVIVLDRDLLSIPEHEIRSTKVLLTVMDGKICYRSQG